MNAGRWIVAGLLAVASGCESDQEVSVQGRLLPISEFELTLSADDVFGNGKNRLKQDQILKVGFDVEIGSKKTKTDSAGLFYLTDLPIGNIPITITKPGFLSINETISITEGRNSFYAYPVQIPTAIVKYLTMLETSKSGNQWSLLLNFQVSPDDEKVSSRKFRVFIAKGSKVDVDCRTCFKSYLLLESNGGIGGQLARVTVPDFTILGLAEGDQVAVKVVPFNGVSYLLSDASFEAYGTGATTLITF